VARFHSAAAAEQAQADFEARFKQHEIPADIPEHLVEASGRPVLLTQVLKRIGLTASTSEAMRMIEQGGVRIDAQKVSDKALTLVPGQSAVLQVGKRKFARVTVS
jgi:tyrosyl-tRNA synthetase